ncbi:MAG: peptidylprolyl isomerase [Chromatiales bacterium]|nr:peptidylprolyl isomerase [Chromatiales bacterium]
MTLAAQTAEKDGLQKDPKVAGRLDLLRTQILAEAASEKFVKANPVTDADLKAEYDTQVAGMPKEYKARHILVDKKETAESIIRELQAGGDFSKIAAKESKDSSGKAGGDLGWFSPQNMVKPFSRRRAGAREGQVHDHAGAERVWLARHHPRRRPQPRGAEVRGREAAGRDVRPAQEAAGVPGRPPQDGQDPEVAQTVKPILSA